MNQQTDLTKYHRRSIRLSDYDYRQQGAYFVTICAHNRECLFRYIRDSVMYPNTLGELAAACWQAIPQHIAHVELDQYVLMPNHMHGIIVIDSDGTRTQESFGNPIQGSLATIVRSFKAAVTHQSGEHNIWQRGYYEHIIRDEAELNRICEYIVGNPARWQEDRDAIAPDW